MRPTLPAIATLTLLLAACAPSARDAAASPRDLPAATMTMRGQLDLGSSTSASRPTPMDVRIEVVIDSLGRPDLGTLRVTGNGSAEHRTAVQRWIEQSRFRPATREGRPVTSMFRTRIETRIRVERIG